MVIMVEIMCYNKGCGQKFDPECNKEDACRFHPGGPIFHDALKGWSCCKKRSTDFTEFLNIPGCTSGCHSNTKPVVPEKPPQEESPDLIFESSTPKVIKPPDAVERPSESEPLQRLTCTVGASLKTALDRQMQQMTLQDHNAEDKSDEEVKVGESCKNNACTKCYEGPDSNLQTCLHHPGCPIFHEGLKYWSCCQRKTTEFDNFLAQEGCTEGKHLWKKKDTGEKKVACRFDWHQTATFVTISVFAKVCIPDKTWVEVNRVRSVVNITFDKGDSVFSQDFTLKGIIDPSRSNVKLLGTKVEINLRKGEPGSWSSLELPKKSAKDEDSESEDDFEYEFE